MNLETAQKWLKSAVGHRNKWRAEAKKAYDFNAGEQWSPEERQVMEDSMRPVTVFNRVAPIVDAIVGHEASNRQAVSYLPRQLGATQVSEVLSSAAKWVRDECGAEGEESDAFGDCVITGEGWTETRVAYDEDIDGRILIERVDPREMDADPASSKKNYADAKWLCRTRKMDRARAQEIWPEGSFEPGNRRDSAPEPIDVITAAFYELDSGSEGRNGTEQDQVLVHDFQWWELEPVYRVQMQQLQGVDPMMLQVLQQTMPDVKPSETGLLTFTEAQWKGIETALPGVHPITQKKRSYHRMFWSGMEMLEEKETPTGDCFSYKAITGKRDQQKHMWYGIVRAMRDPQRWSNKFMSLALEIIATSGKGGVMAEVDAFKNPRQAEEDWANPSKIVYMTQGAIAAQKVIPRPASAPPPGMQELMMYANQSLNDVAGVNPAVMGFSQALDVSGVLEQTRQQAGLNLLSYLFDGLRRYRKEQGVLLMKMIRDYIPPGRLVKIEGQDGARFVPLVYDETIEHFDIVVDEAPSAPNVKERTWDTFIAIAPHLPPAFMSPQILMSLMDYSPFPAALVSKWKQASMPPPNPMEQQAQQAQMGMVQAKTQQAQADAQLKQAQAQHIGQVDPTELASQQMQLHIEELKAHAEVEAAQAKTQQTHLDAGHAMLKHHLDVDAAMRKAALDAQKAQLQAQPPTEIS